MKNIFPNLFVPTRFVSGQMSSADRIFRFFEWLHQFKEAI